MTYKVVHPASGDQMTTTEGSIGNPVETPRIGLAIWTRLGPRGRNSVAGVVGTVAFLLIWQLISVSGLLHRDALPPALATIANAFRLLTDTQFLANVGSTLWASLVGFAWAAIIAVPLGLVLGLSRQLYSLTSTVMELLRPLPPVAFVPLLVLTVGQSLEMKASVIVIGCVWPLLTNTIHGVHSTDPTARATGQSFGWNRFQLLYRVVWPSAVPSVLTGVRITTSIALVLCVGAEFIGGSPTGLGSWLLQQSLLPDSLQAVAAGVIVAGMLGLIVNAAVSTLEKRFAQWARRQDS